MLPYARTAQLLGNHVGHSVSTSFLVNNNRRLGELLEPFIKKLRKKLLQQPVLHADKTGYDYKGQRHWLHTLCTQKHTLYIPHEKRGKQAMDAMDILPDYKGIQVHDFGKPYNEYICNHALCKVHHFRDLSPCKQVLKCSCAAIAKQFLLTCLKNKYSKRIRSRQPHSKPT